MNIYEYFFQNSQDFCCIANLEGYFEIINPNFEKLLGYSKKELLENRFFNFIHPDDIDATEKELQKLKTGEFTINFVNRYRKIDGGYLWFEWNTTPDTSERKIYAIARNITERKLAAIALQESEEKYRDLFDNAYDIIQYVDATGKILYVNNSWKKATGYSDDEIKSKTIFEIIAPDYLENYKKVFERLLKGEDIGEFETSYITKFQKKIIINGSTTVKMVGGKMISTRCIMRDITQKKIDEEKLKINIQELKNSEQQIQNIFDNAPDPIILIDSESLVVKWNSKAENVFGWKTTEVIGKPLYDFIIPLRYRDKHKEGMNRFLTIGKSQVLNKSYEVEAINQKGVEFPVSLSLSSFLIEGKYFFIGFVRDISETKKTLDALKISESFLNSIIENIPSSIFVKDAKDFKYVRLNKAIEEFYGSSKEEIIGKSDYDLFPKEEADRFVLNDKKALETGKIIETEEEPAHTKYKGVRIIETKVGLINDSNGKPVYILGIANDITEQKKAEKKMSELAAIVDSSNDAIISKSLEGIILSWNRAAEKIFGYSAEEAIGKSISIIMEPQHVDEINNIIEKVGHGEQIINFETIKIKKGGEKINVSLTASPIKNKAEEITAISIISRDITEKKMMSAELVAVAEELKRSNTELEQFAYVASHDLQEPLRMVTSYLQLLEKRYKDKLDKDATEFIGFAVDGSNRMRALIQSLLAYSRINRVKPFEEINLDEQLKDVLENLSTTIKENNAIIKIDELPEIYGDPVLINQVFQNLIENAIKFRNSKTPEIIISGKKINNEYLFSVKDNGIGIQKEYLDKIFVIFKRLHSKDKYPGTGMGLAICKKIVERHGGKIWVESEIDKGSTFYFTIKEKSE